MGVADGETTGVTDEHTGVEIPDDGESTGLPNIEDDNMVAIDAAIAEREATLDQEIREINAEPEEIKYSEETKDVELSHLNTTTKSTRRVYNLLKVKNGNRGRDYSNRFGDHLVALVYITLTQLSMKSGLRNYKREGRAAVMNEFLDLHTLESFGPLRS